MPSVSRSISPNNYHLQASDEIEIILGFELEMDIEDFGIGHRQHLDTLVASDDDMEAEATLLTIPSLIEAQWEELSQEERDRLMSEVSAAPTGAASAGYVCHVLRHLENGYNDDAHTTSDVSDDEWHECQEGSPNPFSNSEYELSDNTYTESEHEFSEDNDFQSEGSDAPLLAATSSHEEESEDHRPFYILTNDERDVYFQMADIMRTMEHKVGALPSTAPTAHLCMAWCHFELAMFGIAAEPRIGEVPVRIPVAVNPESASEWAQSVGEVPWEDGFY